MQTTMYETLLQLPLFRGMSTDDLSEVLKKVPFEFKNINPGESFIEEGSSCEAFVMLISGSIVSSKSGLKEQFALFETINAPFLIEPYSMFGAVNKYTHSYVAKTPVTLFIIEKNYMYTELKKYDIFRMNLLNIISKKVQDLQFEHWNITGTSLRERMLMFVRNLSDTGTGERHIKIRMEVFAKILGETRLNVSKELNRLEDEGLIILKRSEVVIPDIERVVKWTQKDKEKEI